MKQRILVNDIGVESIIDESVRASVRPKRAEEASSSSINSRERIDSDVYEA